MSGAAERHAVQQAGEVDCGVTIPTVELPAVPTSIAAPCQRCFTQTLHRSRVTIESAEAGTAVPPALKVVVLVCMSCADRLIAAWYRVMAG